MLIEVLEGKIVSVMQTIEEQQVKKCELRDFFFYFLVMLHMVSQASLEIYFIQNKNVED